MGQDRPRRPVGGGRPGRVGKLAAGVVHGRGSGGLGGRRSVSMAAARAAGQRRRRRRSDWGLQPARGRQEVSKRQGSKCIPGALRFSSRGGVDAVEAADHIAVDEVDHRLGHRVWTVSQVTPSWMRTCLTARPSR